MTKEEMTAVISDQLKGFEANLQDYQTKEGLEVSFKEFKENLVKELKTDELGESLKSLEEAVVKQGEKLSKMIETAPKSNKTIKEMLSENIDKLKELGTKGQGKLELNVDKSIVQADITSDVAMYNAPGVGQIARSNPYVREQLGINVVQLGKNSHGAVSWYEQSVITNNASNVAEGATPGSQSDINWVRKSLSDARIKDFIKVSKDQLQDVDFVAGEVRNLILRNMRIKENSQLISGAGTGNEIKGLLAYASSFTTTGISIANANLFDLCGKVKTQILNNGYGMWSPNAVTLNPSDLDDEVRYKKDAEGRYLFPEWAYGNASNLGGVKVVENPIVTANSLLMGDFGVATLYQWNNMTIEIGYVGTDFTDGYVTIMAYQRENLRVNDADANAIVSITDIDTAIAAITETGA